MSLDEDRWMLTVHFDAPGTDPEYPLGEAAEFYGLLLQDWGEESEPDIEWNGDIVRATCSVLCHLERPVAWLLARTVPRRVTLARNEPRGGPWS